MQSMTQHVTHASGLELGKRIREARGDANLTLSQVARALGVDVRTVARWQSDDSRPSYERLVAFAALVGKPPSWFLEDKEAAVA